VRYPKIQDVLYRKLIQIESSRDGKFSYYPCKVMLIDGKSIERAYVQEETSYINIWGIYPDEDKGKNYIPIAEVKDIEESPYRLAPKLANKIYMAGESGMGYCVFTLVMKNGDKLPFVTGGAVDFVDLPPEYSYNDIIDVLPHVGKEKLQDKEHRWINLPYTKDAKYWWCLYSK